MKEYGHLKSYEIILTAKSPLFIGSGMEYSKKEYYYDRAHGKVHIINIPAMLSMLYEKNLIDDYEDYILNSNYDLCRFFDKVKITKSELNDITEYTADVGDALVPDKSLAGIKQFVRDKNGRPYIPGSSLKGCLRTAILWKMITEDKSKFHIEQEAKMIEKYYLNKLKLNTEKWTNEVNDIMRSIMISDSEAISSDRIILTKKVDLSVHGKARDINVIREAIAPNTNVRLIMTIDSSIGSYIDIDFIRSAIREYGSYYYKSFQKFFRMPADSVQENFENCLILGGGSGYFGKNIVYPPLNWKEAVKQVSAIMAKNAKSHYHEMDVSLGISPRILKITKYQGASYHYGVCRIEIR